MSPPASSGPAPVDDADGPDPVSLVFRHTIERRLLELFPTGARVLALGCGGGELALELAARGRRVVGIDPSPPLIALARENATARGFAEPGVRFEARALESLADVEGPFDGAFSGPGALERSDLGAVGWALADALRPGARVLLSLLGPWPLPAIAARALTGAGESRRASAPDPNGLAAFAACPSPREAREALGPAFTWRDGFALGVLLPGPGDAAFAERHPQTFGLLAMLESLCRGWPLLRDLGDQNVIEGWRR